MKEDQTSFLGKGWAFPPAFDRSKGQVQMIVDDEDIRQSIRIILGTIPGERPMNPDFGCGIRRFVFETNDPTFIRMIKDTVYNALLYHEPRISVTDIEIKDDTFEAGLIHIHIYYTIIITNTRNNMVFPFYLNEGTLL